MRGLIFFIAGTLLAASYTDEAATWRLDYESSLKAPTGWLSVAGLFWLKDGENKLPMGTFTLSDKKVSFNGKVLKPNQKFDTAGVTVAVITRDGKYGIREWDPKAETLRDFTGSKWFPASESWKVTAKWTPYTEPKKIPITNILGMTSQEPVPGIAEFTVNGKTVKLEPVLEGDELFFMFKDSTTGKTTYPAGRFLYAPIPKGTEVVLDFNESHNPPCAFTAFATCPLPPRQNTMAVAIEAGELNYGHH